MSFNLARPTPGTAVYFREPTIRALVEFFEAKGLAAIKDEDFREQWYEDWLAHQTSHQLYARLLSPAAYSRLGSTFDPLRYARFLEVIGYFSAAHGYSLQVSSLGLWSVLLGDNDNLKREAVRQLESGGLLAFGISEKDHGSDLLGNEFTIRPAPTGGFIASGAKYYIGNANQASMIAVLARRVDESAADRGRRSPVALVALRPSQVPGWTARKVRTLGVRAAFVGEFEVRDHPVAQADVIAEGRRAWDAVFGAVTLGKLFLGFGSIGIGEHAFDEASAHLRARTLYGKPAIDMPHLRATLVQAYSRLAAMKLYAFRALDYLVAAHADDRRYLLFAAVQKARLTTEGVRVVSLLSECIGAKGFEADTYFEMALRDVQLFPGLEGSMHINLGQAAAFIPRYFADPAPGLPAPPVQAAALEPPAELSYPLEARSGALSDIAFGPFLAAFAPLISIANVRAFVRQAKAFQLLVRGHDPERSARAETPEALALGQCLATIAYAQLVAENAVALDVPRAMVATIFHSFVHDLNAAALTLASCRSAAIPPHLLRRLIAVPRITPDERESVAAHMIDAYDPRGRTA